MRWESFEEFLADTEARGTESLREWHGEPAELGPDRLEAMTDLARQSVELAQANGLDNLAGEWEDYLGDLEAEPSERRAAQAEAETLEEMRRRLP